MLRRISFARTPRRISWCFSEAISSIQTVTIKMSNHHRLDDGMRRRIVGRLEAGLFHVQICRELTLTPRVVSNLWKQFQDSVSIERKPPDCHLSIIEMRHRGVQLLNSLVTCMQPQKHVYEG
ncbi:uncharacterized protein TNCV_1991471 [Trichonephila clavipes]|nr:uncharacterized protein TNCV_1991471 [Trichonephila clavipes]